MKHKVFFVAVLVLGMVVCHSASNQAGQVKFDQAEIFFEYNSTDLDLGVHIFFDAEGWKDVVVSGPDGTIFHVNNDGSLREIGSTEVFTESEEPPLDEGDLEGSIAAFLALFPEGEYQFSGTTVEGDSLMGKATLTHDLPAPVELDLSMYPTISWSDNSAGGDPEIVGYQVVNELVVKEGGEERVFEFSVDLPADVTEVTVPDEFVELADRFSKGQILEYKVEVIAIEESGNKTIVEESLI
ncbi:MAG: hypothetical protein AB1756_09970 [Acidobacteriota bacterium]